MALLLKKKHIINSQGQEELLNIYTTKTEAVDTGKPCKVVKVEVDGEIITGYIGCTDELDTLKASSKRISIDGKQYAERKYMGIKNFINYMGIVYPDTYQTMTELPEDFPDASDSTTMQQCFDGCKKIIKYPHLDTRNSTNFQTMFRWNEDATEFPVLNTSKGTNFSTMYEYCSSGLNFPQLDTKLGNNFRQMYDRCSFAEKVSDIDLSSISFNDISTKFVNMLRNCTSLLLITFNNVPQGVTEEQLRTATGAPSTCQIIINYRQIKPQTPIRIIKAENMKLVDIDVNGDMPIIREGDKPLDEYIVNSGDWGTIYDDGANFKCFVTKDNLIYCGAGYNSTNRKEFQPEIPDGIEVPNCSFNIEHRGTVENYSYLMTNVSFKSWEVPLIRGSQFTTPYEYYRINNYSYTNDDILISDYYQIAIKNAQKKQISIIDRYQIGEMPLSFTYGRIREQSFSQFNIYEGKLFAEELEAELNKIKGITSEQYYDPRITNI